MPDISRAKFAVDGLSLDHRGLTSAQDVLNQVKQLLQTRAFAARDIVHLRDYLGSVGRGGQKIGLNDIGNKAKIAARLAVSIDENRFSPEQGRNPSRNDCRI